MSSTGDENEQLLSALDKLFAKYFEEKENYGREKTAKDRFWGTYLRSMEGEDEARPKDWDGNTGSILTFTGLFAATVAAFLIESYTSLSPDPSDQTVVLLTQLLAVVTNSSSSSTSTAGSISDEEFSAPLSAVLVNVLWFSSLIIALACALLATLVQQWSRDYVRDIKERDTLDENVTSRAMNHVYIRTGIDRYGMDGVVNIIVALVHLSVLIFAAGLILFLLPINSVVSWGTLAVSCSFGVAYLVAGVLPIFDPSCPFRTPLTYPLSPARLPFAYTYNMRIWSLIPTTWLHEHFQWFCGGTLAVYSKIVAIMKFAYLKRLYRRFVESWFRSLWRLRFGKSISSIKRRIPQRRTAQTMTVSRFRFVWNHMQRQIFDNKGDSLDSKRAMLLVFFEILDSTPNHLIRFGCIDYLLQSWRLASDLADDLFDFESADSETCLAILEITCALLARSYAFTECPRRFLYLRSLLRMIGGSRSSHRDPAFVLSARLCLSSLRASLVHQSLVSKQTSATDSDNLLATFREKYLSKVFAELNQTFDRWVMAWSPLTHDEASHRHVLDQPKGLLLFLNSPQHNTLEAPRTGDTCGSDWSEDNLSSCLLPLHDADCCQSRDAGCPEHAVLCTVFTMVTHILRAPQADRDQMMERAYLNGLGRLGHLWCNIESNHSFHHALIAFENLDVNRKDGGPSREFMAMLYDAGLGDWLEPGNIAYDPPSGMSDARFFRTSMPIPTSYDIAAASIIDMQDIVMKLARCVDMSLARPGLIESIRRRPPAYENMTPVITCLQFPISASNGHRSHEAVSGPGSSTGADLNEIVIDNPADSTAVQPPDDAIVASESLEALSSGSNFVANHGHRDDAVPASHMEATCQDDAHTRESPEPDNCTHQQAAEQSRIVEPAIVNFEHDKKRELHTISKEANVSDAGRGGDGEGSRPIVPVRATSGMEGDQEENQTAGGRQDQ